MNHTNQVQISEVEISEVEISTQLHKMIYIYTIQCYDGGQGLAADLNSKQAGTGVGDCLSTVH